MESVEWKMVAMVRRSSIQFRGRSVKSPIKEPQKRLWYYESLL